MIDQGNFGWLLKIWYGKLCSPWKTVEGLAGDVLSATIFGALVWPIIPFTLWLAGLKAFLIAMLGFLGGVVMSAIKRDSWDQGLEQLDQGSRRDARPSIRSRQTSD